MPWIQILITNIHSSKWQWALWAVGVRVHPQFSRCSGHSCLEVHSFPALPYSLLPVEGGREWMSEGLWEKWCIFSRYLWWLADLPQAPIQAAPPPLWRSTIVLWSCLLIKWSNSLIYITTELLSRPWRSRQQSHSFFVQSQIRTKSCGNENSTKWVEYIYAINAPSP